MLVIGNSQGWVLDYPRLCGPIEVRLQIMNLEVWNFFKLHMISMIEIECLIKISLPGKCTMQTSVRAATML